LEIGNCIARQDKRTTLGVERTTDDCNLHNFSRFSDSAIDIAFG